MQNQSQKQTILALLTTLLLLFPATSLAEGIPSANTLDAPETTSSTTSTSTTTQPDTLLPLPDSNIFGLPNLLDFSHPDLDTLIANNNLDAGTRGVAAVALWAFDILRYLIGALALFLGAIAAIRFIKARGREDEVSRSKRWFEWAAVGMIIFSLALPVKKIFILGGDGFFLSSTGVAVQSQLLNQTIEFVLNFLTYILGAIAVFSITVSGLRLIAFSEMEEVVERQKKGFQWGLIGLAIFIISRELISSFFGRYEGSSATPTIKPDTDALSALATTLSDFLLYFIGPLALLAIIIAAILYTTAGTNEANKEKAKKIIIGTITAIVIAYSSYTIVAEIALTSQGN